MTNAAPAGRATARFDLHRDNRLLAALPDPIMDQISSRLDVVDLIKGATVFKAREPARQILFPHTGVVSMIAMGPEEVEVEVATVGSEGVTGLPFILGADTVDLAAVVQVPGRASRMETAPFRQAVETLPEFRRLMARYALAVLTQVIVNAVCYRLHDIESRCARWLLTAHDSIHGDAFL